MSSRKGGREGYPPPLTPPVVMDRGAAVRIEAHARGRSYLRRMTVGKNRRRGCCVSFYIFKGVKYIYLYIYYFECLVF